MSESEKTEGEQASFIQRRRHYRLRYPKGEGPEFSIVGDNYQVSEISEGGLRLSISDKSLFELDQSVEGILRFRDADDESDEFGTITSVSGRILRFHNEEVVVQLDPEHCVSFQQVASEQLRIHRNYPYWDFRSDYRKGRSPTNPDSEAGQASDTDPADG